MKINFPGVLMFCGLLGSSVPAFAHHGFSVEFDGSKCMNLKGTLTGIDWENPHAYFHMDVRNDQGKVEAWSLEMITPNALKRNGTTRQDFLGNVGKPVAARACPTKAAGRSTAVQRSSWRCRMAKSASLGNSSRRSRPSNFTFNH